MPTRTVQVPTFLGGISQQSPAIRRSNLVEDAKNVEFMATEGTIKRYPTQHVGSLGADLTGYKCLAMERDDADYAICIGDGDIKVFDAAGDAVTVRATGGYGYLSGLNYEDLRVQVFSDTAFVLNREMVVTGTAGKTDPSWQQTFEAGVFVRNSNYSTEFSIKIKTAAMASAATCAFTTPGATYKRDRNSRGQNYPTPSPTQQAGTAPFVYNQDDSGNVLRGPRVNGLEELYFNLGGTQPAGNSPPTGGVDQDRNDFTFDPFTNEV